jgi:acyl carrier protein
MDDVTLTPAVTWQQVFDCISGLLPRLLERELPAIAADTKLMAELGLRSSSTLELLLELELALDIDIDVEDIDEEAVSSIGSLAGFVASHCAETDPDLS